MSNGVTEAEWRVELEFDRAGAYHMQRDEELAIARRDNPTLSPVLRLFTWRPPAISIGYQQERAAIDERACASHGVDVVRRPTGGRAVLHRNELTYSVIMREPNGMGIYAAHNAIVSALMLSLSDLGREYHELTLTAAGKNVRENFAPGSLTNAACFASTARHEVTWCGRKVIGSAQRRFGTVVLQHGSILLTQDHLLLPELLELALPDRDRVRAMLERETATLADVFGRTITPEEAANSLQRHFIDHICSRIRAPEPITQT